MRGDYVETRFVDAFLESFPTCVGNIIESFMCRCMLNRTRGPREHLKLHNFLFKVLRITFAQKAGVEHLEAVTSLPGCLPPEIHPRLQTGIVRL